MGVSVQETSQSAGVCGTVTGATIDELLAARDAVAAEVDLVELRCDGLAAMHAGRLLAGPRPPVIVTCRPAWEGGRFEGPEDVREAWLRAALAAGADLVDVEWRAPFRDRLLALDGARVVLSMHDFAGVPGDLDALAAAMAATGAALVKIAVTVERLADLVPLAALGERYRGRGIVLIAMGATGLPTRVLAARFGSRWTYAGDDVAPGQVAVGRLRDEFRFARITRRSELYALIGRPTGHSASPAMHNAAFDALGLDAAYVACEPADVADFMAFAEAFGIRGCSVTRPFKQAALAAAAHADPLARRIGAANTWRRGADGWEACNTDVEGFLRPLGARRDIHGLEASVIGAGGAARAVVAALVQRGAVVTVHARRPEQAAALEPLGAQAGEWPPAPHRRALLVNTTPVGTWPAVEALPVPLASLPRPADGRGLVYDLVANPEETRLLREARARGLETISGLEMLVAQGAAQFEWWTGRPAPVEAMREAARRRLGRDAGTEGS